MLAAYAPSRETKKSEVYLPGGPIWYDFWTGERTAGGVTVHTPAPIDIMPLFVKGGSIVPLGPVMQYAAERPPDTVELRVYRGKNGEFTLYEDENEGYGYERGVHATIPMRWDEQTQTLTLGSRHGSFPGMLKARNFEIVFVEKGHGTGVDPTPAPDRVVRYTGEELRVPLSGDRMMEGR